MPITGKLYGILLGTVSWSVAGLGLTLLKFTANFPLMSYVDEGLKVWASCGPNSPLPINGFCTNNPSSVLFDNPFAWAFFLPSFMALAGVPIVFLALRNSGVEVFLSLSTVVLTPLLVRMIGRRNVYEGVDWLLRGFYGFIGGLPVLSVLAALLSLASLGIFYLIFVFVDFIRLGSLVLPTIELLPIISNPFSSGSIYINVPNIYPNNFVYPNDFYTNMLFAFACCSVLGTILGIVSVFAKKGTMSLSLCMGVVLMFIVGGFLVMTGRHFGGWMDALLDLVAIILTLLGGIFDTDIFYKCTRSWNRFFQ